MKLSSQIAIETSKLTQHQIKWFQKLSKGQQNYHSLSRIRKNRNKRTEDKNKFGWSTVPKTTELVDILQNQQNVKK